MGTGRFPSGILFRPAAPGTDNIVQDEEERASGQQHHADDKITHIFLDNGQRAKIVPRDDNRKRPAGTPEEVIEEETPVPHGTDPGNERGEGADERDKTGNEDCSTAVFFKEPVGTVNIFLFHQGREPFKEKMKSHIIPDPVIDRIAYDCPKDNGNKEPPDIEHPARRSGPPDKEQRISRQEREYDKTRFKKDNEEQDKVCPDTVFMDYGNHILVDMKKKGDQRIYHRFWKIMYSVSILT